MRLLYKYFPLQSVEHVGRIKRLLQGWVYFSSVGNFNDPFEMSPVLAPPAKATVEEHLVKIGAIAAGVSKSTQRKVIEAVQTRIRTQAPPAVGQEWVASMGVLCLTVEPKDLLMWAHYASSHTGVCVGFDSSLPPFSEARAVKYVSERPTLPGLEPNFLGSGVVDEVLLRKSPHWKYEQEWRIVKRPIRDEEKEFYRGKLADGTVGVDDVACLLADEGGPGQYQFPPQAVRQVIFGAKVTKAFKEQIQEHAKKQVQLKCLQAEVDRKYFVLNLLPCTDA